MDKQTLSHYGWIIIVVLLLSVMLAFATPFGKYVGKGVSNIAMAMGIANDNAVDANNIDKMGKEWEDYLNGGSVGGYDHNAPELHPNNVKGSEYEYGDYEYIYYENHYLYGNGWVVSPVADKTKTTYGPILESINGKPVVALYHTFVSCVNMTVAPIIPSGVTILDNVFYNCSSLKTYIGSADSDGDFSNYKIPDGVTRMPSAFHDCTSIIKTPNISNCTQLTLMQQAFCGCTALIDASNITIPNSVTNMEGTFDGCTSLVAAPNMSNAISVTNMDCTFAECASLTTVIDLSNCTNLTNNLWDTFYGCTSLTDEPKLPSTVTIEKEWIFNGCTQLGYEDYYV